jgi:hypothetical protein
MKKYSSLQKISIIAATALAVLAGCSTTPSGSIKPLGGAPITVFAAPVNSGGTIPGCPGTYAGYVNYTKSLPAWGWVPSTNTTVFTATDGSGRTDTKTVYLGKNFDTGCAQTPVTVPNPPVSAKYRFTIYFPSNVPSTNYPITLTGFDP